MKASDSPKKPKALILFSGGLDSMLASKIMLDQSVDIEAVYFMTPFSTQDEKPIENFCEKIGIQLHKVSLGQEFLDMIVNPPHGYGSQMNPCIDCRILMFKKAKKMAKKVMADFLVTGEVLNERPFSQRKDVMLHIEKEAGLNGKIIRPLSAKLLPESIPERKELINREKLFAISGRRRTAQIELAKKLGIKEYPSPSGGCLLTEIRFSERLKDHLKHEGRLTLLDVRLLRVGRHFRVNGTKVVVGRNEEENERLLSMIKKNNLTYLQVINYVGPVTLIIGEANHKTKEIAAAITVRYSDTNKTDSVKVKLEDCDGMQVLDAKPIEDNELKRYSI